MHTLMYKWYMYLYGYNYEIHFMSNGIMKFKISMLYGNCVISSYYGHTNIQVNLVKKLL